ncbi:MAG: peptide chain release factor N(5)-glutamine methyltransferase [Microthrixaceae bacterium]
MGPHTGGPGDLAGTVAWSELLSEATARLRRAGLDTAASDARRIVEEASGLEGAELIVSLEDPVTERAMARFDDMIARREAGEPLQYVLGRWGFRRLDLAVDPRVLIPRPETEMLVEAALGHLDRLAARIAADGERRDVVVADLGTGSGAIALSVASERTNTTVWACDASPAAVAAARANLAGIGRAAVRVRIVEGEWFDAFSDEQRSSFDLIITNPPYVSIDDELPAEVAEWEPAVALFAGADGLDDLRHIISEAPRWLRPAGVLAVELDPRQVAAVRDLMTGAGFTSTEVHQDLAGRDRIVIGRLG